MAPKWFARDLSYVLTPVWGPVIDKPFCTDESYHSVGLFHICSRATVIVEI